MWHILHLFHIGITLGKPPIFTSAARQVRVSNGVPSLVATLSQLGNQEKLHMAEAGTGEPG